MSNFIFMDKVGLLAIPDFITEEEFYKYLFENYFVQFTGRTSW